MAARPSGRYRREMRIMKSKTRTLTVVRDRESVRRALACRSVRRLEALEDAQDVAIANERIAEMERTGEKPAPADEFWRSLGL